MNICKTHENHTVVSEKFNEGENGNLINRRLALEVSKRKNYAESRRKNRSDPKTYVPHMENENINEIKDVIDCFNNICGTKFRHTEGNIKAIGARFKEGYTKENCVLVITRKYDQWKSDPEMSKFIRIETIFRPSKFESYLNEKPTESRTQSDVEKTDKYLDSLQE